MTSYIKASGFVMIESIVGSLTKLGKEVGIYFSYFVLKVGQLGAFVGLFDSFGRLLGDETRINYIIVIIIN